MGTLANSVFIALMGWIRAVALEIWNTFSAPEGTTIMQWIGDHWKGLAIALCAAGMVIDLIVYLFRWQPYRIWRSRRAARHREEETAETPNNDIEENQYDPENAPAEEIPLSAAAAELAPSLIRQARMERKDAPESREESAPGGETRWDRTAQRAGGRRRSVARYVASRYDGEPEEEIASARWTAYRSEGPRGGTAASELPGRGRGETAPTDEPPEPAGRTTEKFEQAIRPRRRRVRNMLKDAQDLETETPDQLIDRNEAYRRPVYPRGWSETERDSQ